MKHHDTLTDFLNSLPDGNETGHKYIDLEESTIFVQYDTTHKCIAFPGSPDEEPEFDCTGSKRILTAVEYDEDENCIWKADDSELEELKIEY